MDQLEVAGEHARGGGGGDGAGAGAGGGLVGGDEDDGSGGRGGGNRFGGVAAAAGGVFEFPWQKCRGGLGVPTGSTTAELRDVFFRSLVDGRVAVVGVPGDRLLPAPSKRALFDDLAAWLAAAGDGEVDPVWRSVLEGPRPAA